VTEEKAEPEKQAPPEEPEEPEKPEEPQGDAEPPSAAEPEESGARAEAARAPTRPSPPSTPALPKTSKESSPAPAERRNPLAAAATLAVLVLAVFLAVRAVRGRPRSAAVALPSVPVVRLEGRPRVAAEPITDKGELHVGMLLDADDQSSARIDLGALGEATLERASRARLVETSDRAKRFELLRGSLHAKTAAPPRVFEVDTPYAKLFDLGSSSFRVEIAPNGRTFVAVEAGAVSVEAGPHAAWVPASAECEVRPTGGVGTVRFTDAPPALRDALDRFDFEEGGHAALVDALAAARARDTLSLWHLVQRTDGEDRAAVLARIRALVPGQSWSTDDALAGETKAMEKMKQELSSHW
jgi:hypothetical protein